MFATLISGCAIWWTLTRERQAWCSLQVKLCDPCLGALKWFVYHARHCTFILVTSHRTSKLYCVSACVRTWNWRSISRSRLNWVNLLSVQILSWQMKSVCFRVSCLRSKCCHLGCDGTRCTFHVQNLSDVDLSHDQNYQLLQLLWFNLVT